MCVWYIQNYIPPKIIYQSRFGCFCRGNTYPWHDGIKDTSDVPLESISLADGWRPKDKQKWKIWFLSSVTYSFLLCQLYSKSRIRSELLKSWPKLLQYLIISCRQVTISNGHHVHFLQKILPDTIWNLFEEKLIDVLST